MPSDRARRSDASGEGAGDVAGAAADVDEVVAEAGAEQLGGSGAQALDGGDRRLFVQRRDQGRRAGVGVDGAEAAERGRADTVMAGWRVMVQAAEPNTTPSLVSWAAIVARSPSTARRGRCRRARGASSP